MKRLFILLAAAVAALNAFGALQKLQKSAKDCCTESINAQPVLYDDGVISISVNAKNDNGKFSNDLTEWRVYESAEAVITIRSKGGNHLAFMNLSFNTTKDAVLMYGNDTVKSGYPVFFSDDTAYLRVKGQGNKGRAGITSFVIQYDDETKQMQFYGVPSSDGDTLKVNFGPEWQYTGNAVLQKNWLDDDFEEQREAFKVIKLMPSVKTAVPFSTKELFRGFASVIKIENLNYLDVSEVTDMRGMFRECFKLESLDLSEFNTSRVTNMSQMFTSCWNLKELDASSFNTENVEYMVDMFCQCSKVTSLDLSKFNTEKVISMAAMFRNCKALRSIDLSSFDTKNVTNMSLMFHECESLESLDLRNFNFGKVKDISSMFYWCASLSEIVCKVKNALSGKEGLESEDMFGSCVSLVGEKGTAWDEEHTDASYARLDEAPENPGYFTSEPRKLYGKFIGDADGRILEIYYDSKMDPTSDYTPEEWFTSDLRYTVQNVWFDESVKQARPASLEALFSGFTSLKTFEHLDYLNTSNVKAMNGMFYDCTSLDTLDLRSFDWSNVTNTRVMFNNCENLKTIYCKQDLNETGIDESEDMFYGCKKLVGQNGTEYNPEHTDKEYAREDDGPESETPGYFTIADKEIYGVISETEFYIYYDRNKDEDEDALSPEEWIEAPGIEAVETVNFQIDNEAKPVSTAEWFHGFTSLTTIENLDMLNTSEVTDMHQMFSGCASLETLDLRSFDWSKVTDISEMFRNCANLTTIYCAEDLHAMDHITASWLMFDGCTALVGGKGTTYSTAHKDASYARPDEGESAPGYFTGKDKPTGVKDVQEDKAQCTKVLRNGILYIQRGGKTYNVTGQITE